MTDARVATVGIQVLHANNSPDARVATVGIQVLHTIPTFDIEVALTPATETDTALPVARTRRYGLAPATTTDEALPVSHARRYTLSTVTETDMAPTIRPGRVYPITPATTTDEAFPFAISHSVRIQPALEEDVARPFLSPQYLITVDLTLGSFIDPRWSLPVPDGRAARRSYRSPLRRALPRTQKGLLIWRDGRVLEVTSWYPRGLYDDADDHIAGGAIWVAASTSWQANVLRDAGYTLVPVNPDEVTLEEEY